LATDVPTRLAWTQRKSPRQAPIEGKKARVTRGGWELPSVFFSSFLFLAKLISPKRIFLIKMEYSYHNIPILSLF